VVLDRIHASGEARCARTNIGCGLPDAETAPQCPVQQLLEATVPCRRDAPCSCIDGILLPPGLPQPYLHRFSLPATPNSGAGPSAVNGSVPVPYDPSWDSEWRDSAETEQLGRPLKRSGAPIPWLPRNLMWELAVEKEWISCEAWQLAKASLFRGLRDRVGGFNRRRAEILPASWTIRTEGRPTPEQLAAGKAGNGVAPAARAAGVRVESAARPMAAPGRAADAAVEVAAAVAAGLAVRARSGLTWRGGKPGMAMDESLDEGRQVAAALQDTDQLAGEVPVESGSVWGLRRVALEEGLGNSAKPAAAGGMHQPDREEPDDDVVCNVCFDGKSTSKSQVVMCDRCDLAVHTTCYGVTEIPDGPWLCDVCKEAKRAQHMQGGGAAGRTRLATEVLLARCCLCETRGGALKLTADGRYVHPICAMTTPGVWIDDFSEMSGIVTSQAAAPTMAPVRLASSAQVRAVARAGFKCRSPSQLLGLLSASSKYSKSTRQLLGSVSELELAAAVTSAVWRNSVGVLLGAGGSKAVQEVLAEDDYAMRADATAMRRRALHYATSVPVLQQPVRAGQELMVSPNTRPLIETLAVGTKMTASQIVSRPGDPHG